jgi:hypothetical protein
MWEHRNTHLHNKRLTIHSGLREQRLEDTIKHKTMWLMSVWTARDNEIHIGPTRDRHDDIVTIYNRWKKKHNAE